MFGKSVSFAQVAWFKENRLSPSFLAKITVSCIVFRCVAGTFDQPGTHKANQRCKIKSNQKSIQEGQQHRVALPVDIG